jgi:hypothetical protein
MRIHRGTVAGVFATAGLVVGCGASSSSSSVTTPTTTTPTTPTTTTTTSLAATTVPGRVTTTLAAVTTTAAAGTPTTTTTTPATATTTTTTTTVKGGGSGSSLGAPFVAAWRQICLPYNPGDGASDITYAITLVDADHLELKGVGKDYKSTSCSGPGVVTVNPDFIVKVDGPITIDGVTGIRVSDPSSPDQNDVLVIDHGRLRFGDPKATRDAAGYPTKLEPPDHAYIEQR